MRKVFIISSLLASILFTSKGHAFSQGAPPAPDRSIKIIEAHIDFKGQVITDGNIIISYSLPFSGMVEFRLYDSEGKKIWQNQYPNNVGDNRIVLRASKLSPGSTYAYQMVYKKDMIMQNLEIPSGGTD